MNLQLHCTTNENYDGIKVLVCGDVSHAFFIAKGEHFDRTIYARMLHHLAGLAETASDEFLDKLQHIHFTFTADIPDADHIIDANGRVR